MGVQTEGKIGERNSALLGETFRGNRQSKFLFDLFLSKCAGGNAPSLSKRKAVAILSPHHSFSVRDRYRLAETAMLVRLSHSK